MGFRLKIFGIELELLLKNDVAESAEGFVRKLFTDHLKPEFTFHNIHHTLNVVNAALQLCDSERCNDAEKEIVALAAYFHDTGFTRLYDCHEDESVHIALRYLNEKGYSQNNLEQTIKCIRATKLGAEACHITEMILQDADMAHLASDNYFSMLTDLRREVESLQYKNYNDKEWLEQNLNFLLQHSYKTYSGKMLWNEQKKKNIEKNRQLLSFL